MAAVDKSEEPNSNAGTKKPSKLVALWNKLGLDTGTLIMMGKGALPPTIFTAMYQSDAIAKTFGTMGYLVTIIASLSLCILPRAKLIQMTIQNSLAVCVAAASTLFGVWTATCARANNPSAPGNPFNGSAAAVSAVWLFANIWLVNVLRAKAPQLAIPVIIYTILISIVYTNSPILTMTRAISTIVLLIKAFMTGFAISLCVGLFVIPVNCRQVWWKIMGGYLQTSKALLNEQKNFLQQHESLSAYRSHKLDDESNGGTSGKNKTPAVPIRKLSLLQKTHSDLFAKLSLELPMAKREIAFGHYTTADLREVFGLLRCTLLPLQGMTAILDIFDRGVETAAAAEDGECKGKEQFAEVMRALHQPYELVVGMCDEAIEHTLLLLQLKPSPKKKSDEESGARVPGELGFNELLEQRIQEFYSTRPNDVQKYFGTQGPPTEDSISAAAATVAGEESMATLDSTHRSQLYLVLFMEYLLYSAAQSLLDLARFAEAKKQEGIIDRKRLVYPNHKRLRKWIYSNDGSDDVVDVCDVGGKSNIGSRNIGSLKDPDHLPASNSMQRLGNFLAFFGEVFCSSESAFGLRVACATIVVALPAFFQETYLFFIEKRIVWAMIVIAIGMSPTSGASLIGFAGRIIGTLIAVIFAFINWYIVDGRTAGVIVFLWFFVAIQFYFIIKLPQTIQSVFTAMITQIMIIGYELQVRKIGQAASEASGQPVLSVNFIGPYRLLVTLGGIGVAFFFTIFPYPTSTRSLIRRDVSGALYLLARSYTNVLSIVRMRVDGTEGDPNTRGSHGRIYEKQRIKLMTESIITLDSLRKNLAFTVFEPSLRGRFPREQYDTIIEACSSITNYLAIISYASKTFTNQSSSNQAWVRDLSSLMKTVDPRSHQVASLMCLLSTCLGNAQPLPPFLSVPEPFRLSKELEERDPQILALNHSKEPGYIAFAVMQVATSIMYADLKKLIRTTESLVGQVELPQEYISQNTSTSSLKSKVP